MIFGYLIEQDIIRCLVKYNKNEVLCFTWLFGSLIVLNLNIKRDVETHNNLIKMYSDSGTGMKYYFKGEEIE